MRTRKLTLSLCFVIVQLAILGCASKEPLYVIDVQKLAGVEPTMADQLLKEMVRCQLRHEDRWEEGQGDVQDIIGKLNTRWYEIDNGQMSKGSFKPMVELTFDPYYEDRVEGVGVFFIEYVDPIEALCRLGYSPKDRLKHLNSSNAWYFITTEYLYQVYLQDTGQSTAFIIDLDALTH